MRAASWQFPAVTESLMLLSMHCLILNSIESLSTSLPGELRLAPHVPSPGWHVFNDNYCYYIFMYYIT